jgi:glycosyltransferase involved in cell wall biosynthesis
LDFHKYHLTILLRETGEVDFLADALKPFPVKLIRLRGRSRYKFISAIIKLLAKKDIHLIHSMGYTSAILSNLANLVPRKPHITTIHQMLRTADFSPPLTKIKKRTMALILAKADYIQSVTHDAENNLIEFLPSIARKKNKLVVIKNGIMIEEYTPGISTSNYSLRKKLNLDSEKYLFGFFGRFMPQKGIIYLINAVEKLSKIRQLSNRFRIIAATDRAYTKYKSIIQSKGISDYFIFPGCYENISCILNELDAVVIPSVSEAGPLLPAEAFLMGCPVIATNCIGLREVIAGSPAIVVKPKDSSSLAEAIIEVIKNRDSIKAKALDFIPRARETFDSRETAMQLCSLFDRALGSRS